MTAHRVRVRLDRIADVHDLRNTEWQPRQARKPVEFDAESTGGVREAR